MKIIFNKLKTSSENIYVDFGDGVWTEHPVNDAKANGIQIPDTCTDYTKIKIKGSVTTFNNLDVITGIKRSNFEDIPIRFYIDQDRIEGHINSSSYGANIENLRSYLYVNLNGSLLNIDSDLDSDELYGGYYIDIGSNQVISINDVEGSVMCNLSETWSFDPDNNYLSNGWTILDLNDDKTEVKGDFEFGPVYIKSIGDGTYKIDETSPGIVGLINEFGSGSFIQFDSSAHYYKAVGTTDRLNGHKETIYKPMEDILDNEYLYVDLGSGDGFEKTNFILKFGY